MMEGEVPEETFSHFPLASPQVAYAATDSTVGHCRKGNRGGFRKAKS